MFDVGFGDKNNHKIACDVCGSGGEMREAVHCATHDETVSGFDRDDELTTRKTTATVKATTARREPELAIWSGAG